MRVRLEKTLAEISTNLLKQAGIKESVDFNIVIPDNPLHGDFATNLAMKLAKPLKKSPRDIAELIIAGTNEYLEHKITAEIAGAGFINFRIDKEYYLKAVLDIVKNPYYFKSTVGMGKKVLLEFVSANPTGPLHIGHGRGAAYGDSVARVLQATGHDVTREYYINDGGNQMNNLGLSIYARAKQISEPEYPFPENGYHGDYIIDVAKHILTSMPTILEIPIAEALQICIDKGIEIIGADINDSLKVFRVNFDNFFSEKTLYKSSAVEHVLDTLKKDGYTYIKDDALWFASSKFGDDKDRVLKKSTGEYTYLTPDIAYHYDKFKRGYDLIIDIWGADHHGYIKRMQSAIEALNFDVSKFKTSLVQMVSLIQSGEKISMSTRSGEFIPLSYLLEEVGVDAARYFYNMRSHDAQFDFDIDLAKSKSNDNPVYYIQYAHARVYSLLANAQEKGHIFKAGDGIERLTLDSELHIIKFMIKFKDVIEQSALHLEPHRIGYHLQELASLFHSYYYANQIIADNDSSLSNARLTLAVAVAKCINYGLEILGVKSPERM